MAVTVHTIVMLFILKQDGGFHAKLFFVSNISIAETT